MGIRTTGKGVYKYICRPNNITILAKDSLLNRRLNIDLYVGDKVALQGSYEIKKYSLEEASRLVKVFCNALTTFTEDEIQDWVEADRVMLALNAYRFLKSVRTINGNLIWTR